MSNKLKLLQKRYELLANGFGHRILPFILSDLVDQLDRSKIETDVALEALENIVEYYKKGK